jgi:uncharacterized protein YjbI with pentapeptide repeats
MTLGEPLIRPIITRSPMPAAAAPATRMSPVQAEQRQLTRRYHAAVSYLGSPSVDARIGGIHALQRIMQDSPRDQPAVVAVLCAFVRNRANTAAAESSPIRLASILTPADIQAALTVVGTRNTAHDGSATVVDLTCAYLSGACLSRALLSGAYLSGANLSCALFSGANLTGAYLTGANLTAADLTSGRFTGAHFSRADLSSADLSGAFFCGADLASADLSGAYLIGADLSTADLSGAHLSGADLSGANLHHTNLARADLSGAELSGADLTGTKGLRTGPPRSPAGIQHASMDKEPVPVGQCRSFLTQQAHSAARWS